MGLHWLLLSSLVAYKMSDLSCDKYIALATVDLYCVVCAAPSAVSVSSDVLFVPGVALSPDLMP